MPSTPWRLYSSWDGVIPFDSVFMSMEESSHGEYPDPKQFNEEGNAMDACNGTKTEKVNTNYMLWCLNSNENIFPILCRRQTIFGCLLRVRMSSFALWARRWHMCYCTILLDLQKVFLGMTTNLQITINHRNFYFIFLKHELIYCTKCILCFQNKSNEFSKLRKQVATIENNNK